MTVAAIIVILLAVLYESLKGSGTANSAPDTLSGVSYQNDNNVNAPYGLSPIDIGGLSLNIPSAVLAWQDLANKYAQINSILDPEEILAIIWNESTGNPNSENPRDPSYGLMGVELAIGIAYGSVSTPQELFEPEKNIEAGSAFLAYLKKRFSGRFPTQWSDGYNEGETKLNKGIILTPDYSKNFNDRVNTLKGLG